MHLQLRITTAEDRERAAPPEDAGGPLGFVDVMEALKNRGHPQHEEIRNWVGSRYDPDKFDMWAVMRERWLSPGCGVMMECCDETQ